MSSSPILSGVRCADLARGADLVLGPTALIVAHPGHEMRIHAWLCRARPMVFVLTDGSGHGDRGRVASTADVLDRAGALRGSVFGRFTDRQAYDLILGQRIDAIRELVIELAEGLVEHDTRHVVCDAVEGMNPVHDLCFLLSRAAVSRASQHLDRRIRLYEFLLDSAPDARVDRADGILWRLDEEELAHKFEVAADYEELRSEVARARATWGDEAFGCEVVYPVDDGWNLDQRVGERPSYEDFGARRVAAGIYREHLQYRRHFRPLADAIQAWLTDPRDR